MSPSFMKTLLTILLLISSTMSFVGCAKEPPFDPVVWFKDAEEKMRKDDFEAARKKYQEIQEKSPDKSYDAVLMLRVADTYFGEEKYSEAQVEYQAFLNYHPVNKDAVYAQYQIAMCSYKELTTIDRDPTPAKTVIKEMRTLLEKYPKSAYVEEAKKRIAVCRDRLSEYELYVAKFYHKKDSYQAAAGRCEKLLKDYPGSPAEKDALYYAGLSYMELGEKDQARVKFEALALKYPAMKKTAQAHLQKLQKP
jgi:outer membrane protein assembly factor BamD